MSVSVSVPFEWWLHTQNYHLILISNNFRTCWTDFRSARLQYWVITLIFKLFSASFASSIHCFFSPATDKSYQCVCVCDCVYLKSYYRITINFASLIYISTLHYIFGYSIDSFTWITDRYWLYTKSFNRMHWRKK